MRISDAHKNNLFLNSIRQNQASTAAFQQQLASGKRVIFSSDDPAAFARSRTVRNLIDANEQYLTNINRASDFIGTSVDALDQMSDRVISLKSLLVNTSTDTLDPGTRQKMATQARMLRDELFDKFNTTWQGTHVFGGTNGSMPAVSFDESTATYTTESTSDVLRIPVSERNTAPATMNADSVRNAGGHDIFELFNQAITALENNDPETLRSLISVSDDVVDGLTTLTTVRANEFNKLSFAADHMAETNIMLKAELSELVETDVLEAYSQLQRFQVAYETMLAVHASDSRTSLLQFL